MSRTIKFGVGILISAVCVWLSMREVKLDEMWHALRHANYFGFLGVMGITVFGFYLRAIRWRSLIAAPRHLSTDSLFSATMIGFMANNVLPFRLGEFVRPWALARREKMSKTTLLATVVVERAIDMVTLLAILGIALAVYPIPSDSDAWRKVRGGAGVLVIMCIALTVFVVALERSEKLARAFIHWLSSPLPERLRDRVSSALDHFIHGLSLFRDLPRLAWVFVLSFAMFFSFSIGLNISMWALGLHVPWSGGLVMLVITAIGIMVPAAPGYIGTLNLACIAGLALFGVKDTLAVPFSWFYWSAQWLPVTLLGLFYLQREGLSLGSLGQMDEGAA